jgi:hypothetical protein
MFMYIKMLKRWRTNRQNGGLFQHLANKGIYFVIIFLYGFRRGGWQSARYVCIKTAGRFPSSPTKKLLAHFSKEVCPIRATGNPQTASDLLTHLLL